MARSRCLQSTIWLYMLHFCLVNFVCLLILWGLCSVFCFHFLGRQSKCEKKNSSMNNVWLLVLFIITLISSSSSSSSSSLIKEPRPNIENIIWNCNSAFLQSFLGYFKSCGLIILEVMIWSGWIGDGSKIIITFWGQGLLSSTQL